MTDYKLMPVEPTPGMLEAARQHHEGEAYLPVSLYKAMLAAAPAVQGEPVGEAGSLPGTSGFTTAVFESRKVPVGTKLYTAPQPAEQQPAPDVAGLVEALEQVIKAAPSGGPLWHGSEQIVEARAALAAHRKGGEA